jgi:hypothetical protein
MNKFQTPNPKQAPNKQIRNGKQWFVVWNLAIIFLFGAWNLGFGI